MIHKKNKNSFDYLIFFMNHFFSKKGGQKFFPIVWSFSFVGRNKTKKKTHDFK
jgi:hypothetical protein